MLRFGAEFENLFVGAYGIKYDGKTNLHYMRYRWYSADQMRFLSPDLLLGINRYAYCNNNPVNFVDIYGNSPAVTIGIGVVLIGSTLLYMYIYHNDHTQSLEGPEIEIVKDANSIIRDNYSKDIADDLSIRLSKGRIKSYQPVSSEHGAVKFGSTIINLNKFTTLKTPIGDKKVANARLKQLSEIALQKTPERMEVCSRYETRERERFVETVWLASILIHERWHTYGANEYQAYTEQCRFLVKMLGNAIRRFGPDSLIVKDIRNLGDRAQTDYIEYRNRYKPKDPEIYMFPEKSAHF